jgi:TfoX/Sxy family transcriptional regulator of competence genes
MPMSPDRPMPSFHKAGSELADRFRATMAAYPEAPVRNTFGSPCAYVNGNMAVGLHGSGWFVRLDSDATQELTAAGGEPFSPMPGRPMTGYTLLPDSILSKPAALSAWIERSLQFAATLPPKAAAAKKR